jgi:hypothetical protein
MKKNYITPEMEIVIIQSLQLLEGSQDSIILSDDYTIEHPEEIH